VETSTPDNARLYRRLGWRDIALVPTPGPPVWIMHRPSSQAETPELAVSPAKD
jgi:hypothetical protein